METLAGSSVASMMLTTATARPAGIAGMSASGASSASMTLTTRVAVRGSAAGHSNAHMAVNSLPVVQPRLLNSSDMTFVTTPEGGGRCDSSSQ